MESSASTKEQVDSRPSVSSSSIDEDEEALLFSFRPGSSFFACATTQSPANNNASLGSKQGTSHSSKAEQKSIQENQDSSKKKKAHSSIQPDLGSLRYDRHFMQRFQAISDATPEIREIWKHFPDLQPKLSGSFGEGAPLGRRSSVGEEEKRATGNKPVNRASSGLTAAARGSKKPQQTHAVTAPKQGTVELGRRAANPWNPLFLNEKDRLIRTIKGTLNKITPENFSKHTTKLCELFSQIKEEAVYREAVSLVFDKAVIEPNFSKLYTELCVKLNDKKPQIADEKITFRHVLLSHCQTVFEKELEHKTTAHQPKGDEGEPKGDESELEKKERARRKKLGNIKFIGELTKCKLLSVRIVHECTVALLKDIIKAQKEKDDASLESNAEMLCKLLATVGKVIDLPEAKQYMESYFQKIQKLEQDHSISPRIRFMFQDLIELRANHWVPRRQENTPKTIAEVHAEAVQKTFDDDYLTSLTLGKHPSPIQLNPSEDRSANGKGKKTTVSKILTKPTQSQKEATPKPSKPKPQASELKPEQLEEQINLLLSEYFTHGDPNEVSTWLKEHSVNDSLLLKLIELGILNSSERREMERELTSSLFSHLKKNGILTENVLLEGLKTVFAQLDDLKMDIPFLPQYLEKFVGLAVLDSCVSRSSAEALVPSSCLDNCKYSILAK